MSASAESMTVVTTLLGEAGLPASPAEIESLAVAYAGLKADIESLYAVEEARYESPCLHFDPDPTFADWW
jgi:hypothetical protein